VVIRGDVRGMKVRRYAPPCSCLSAPMSGGIPRPETINYERNMSVYLSVVQAFVPSTVQSLRTAYGFRHNLYFPRARAGTRWTAVCNPASRQPSRKAVTSVNEQGKCVQIERNQQKAETLMD